MRPHELVEKYVEMSRAYDEPVASGGYEFRGRGEA
jgi:hypothetical protein